MSSLESVFGPGGRLPRGAFFLRVLLVLALFAVFDAALDPLLGAAAVWLLNPVALWALGAAMVRRLHDRNLSGWWLLAGLVPVAGAVWLLWQFCRAGVPDANRWGADPRQPSADFLVVR